MILRRTGARTLSVLTLAAPLALAFAPSAFAATGPASFDSATPADGTVFTGSDSSVTVSATLPACTRQQLGNGCASTVTSTLALSAPGQSGQSVTKKSTTSTQSLSLTVAAGQPNAVWTVTLTGASSRSFTINQVNVPESFSADGSGSRDVAFAWNKGSESDITGFVLANSNGSIIDTLTPESANCASSARCSYGLYYPADNPGSHGYQLVAKRPSATGGTVLSSAASANATLITPPKPTPTPTPSATAGPSASPAAGGGGSNTTGGATGGTTGSTPSSAPSGSPTGGTTASPGGTINSGDTKPTLPPSATNSVVASRRAFALTFNAFSPSLGIPKLPPLPATDLASIGEQPLPLGTYKPSLPYSAESETTKTRSLVSSPTAFVETITDPEQLAKSIAGALILLLVGAHLRRFLGTHVED